MWRVCEEDLAAGDGLTRASVRLIGVARAGGKRTVAERCCAMRRKRGATRPCRCSVSLRRVDERFVFFAMPSRSVTHARSVSPPACACDEREGGERGREVAREKDRHCPRWIRDCARWTRDCARSPAAARRTSRRACRCPPRKGPGKVEEQSRTGRACRCVAILVTRSRSTSSCSDCPDLSVFVMYCSSPT